MSAHPVHAFSEKVALISDGDGPIGRAVAMQLALLGSYVVVRSSAAGTNAIEELVALGTLARSISADVTTNAGAVAAASEVGASFGRLDLLVNCLKLMPESSFESNGDAEFDAVVGANFRSAYMLTKACLPLMNERPKPRIVNVVTRSDSPDAPLFRATQAAVEEFTRTLAATLPAKFRVNAVAITAPASGRAGFDPELFPMASTTSADDAARAVLFLLSPEAVGVNGQVLEVKG